MVWKETVVEGTKSSFSLGKCHSHCSMMILCTIFYLLLFGWIAFFRKAYDAEISVHRDRGRKRYVSRQKYQLADIRNQYAEITGIKHRPIINLTFHNRFVICFGHQNSGLYSCTK